jgi:hypothetical protein
MSVEIVTGRGVYRLVAAAPLEYSETDVVLTLAIERADGVERFVIRCRLPATWVRGQVTMDVILNRLKDRFAQNFETIRELSLKAIRSERRLHEIAID